MTAQPAPEIIMDPRGFYWRRYPEHLSMCPVTDDNDTVDGPWVHYRRDTEHAENAEKLLHGIVPVLRHDATNGNPTAINALRKITEHFDDDCVFCDGYRHYHPAGDVYDEMPCPVCAAASTTTPEPEPKDEAG